MTIKKLVDKDSLSTLLSGYNTKIKEKISTEETRAKNIESNIQSALNESNNTIASHTTTLSNITDTETGILATANANTQQKVDNLSNNLSTVDSKVTTNTNDIAGLKQTNLSQDSKITDIETKLGVKASEGVEATGIYKDINDLNTSVSNINVDDAINQAKSYTDQKITDLINGAPEALDTLKELGDKLTEEGDAVSALTTTVAGKANSEHNHNANDVTGLSAVATSNSYEDLDNKPTLADFEYINPMYPDITTLQSAMNELLYVAPSINSFTCNVSNDDLEIGSTITPPLNFNWELNKIITTQSINGLDDDIDATVRTAIYNGSAITTNKTFTLSVSDGKNSASKSISYSFKHKRYWGISAAPTEYDSAFILGLSNKEFATSNNKSEFSITSEKEQYIYYCSPTAWGNPTFNVNGFNGGFEKVTTIDFTNASGNTTPFDIWKSENTNLGKQDIIIK